MYGKADAPAAPQWIRDWTKLKPGAIPTPPVSQAELSSRDELTPFLRAGEGHGKTNTAVVYGGKLLPMREAC